MKKILFYIDYIGTGGAQRVMVNLVNWFVKRHYDITLVNDFKNPDGFFPVDLKVKRLYLADHNRGNKVIKNMKRIRKLRKIVTQEEPELVVSFLGLPNIRMLVSTHGLPVKKVISVRNDPKNEYGRINKKILELLFAQANGIVFQSMGAQQYFSAKIQDKSAIILNPVGDEFYQTVRTGMGTDIVACGRLEKQKNHKLLIDAFALICDEIPNENLVIYGEGNDREALEKYVISQKLRNRVKFPGAKKEIPPILAHAKVFILSSDYEGLPNALMEALAVGVPSISTDCPCGGSAYLIENGVNGVLIKVGDVQELADAMKNILSDEKYAERLGKNARIRAKEYRTGNIMGKWEQYFNDIMG